MKIVMVGPVYPYKTGLSYYTTLLYNQLKKNNEVILFSYSMQYPKILFKKEQKDYEDDLLKINNVKYNLNTASIFSSIKLANEINKLKADLIIFQWLHPYFAPCYSIICNHLKNIKKLFICHNVFPHERFMLDKFLTKLTLKKGDYFITHSVSDANDLKSILPNAKIKIGVHPSYDFFNINKLEKDEAINKLNIILKEHNEIEINNKNNIILFFGLIRQYKGLSHLINAIKYIENKSIQDDEVKNIYANLKLIIAGSFSSKQNYVDLIEKYGIKNHIVIVDEHIKTRDVEKYFSSCDVVCLPYESATQSGVIQVAYSFNKPVIATTVGGLPDVVINNETGYLVEPKNPEKLGEAIIKFFKEKNNKKFSDGIEKQKYKYSWERMEENIDSLMQLKIIKH